MTEMLIQFPEIIETVAKHPVASSSVALFLLSWRFLGQQNHRQ